MRPGWCHVTMQVGKIQLGPAGAMVLFRFVNLFEFQGFSGGLPKILRYGLRKIQ